jgi:hypothetical protein
LRTGAQSKVNEVLGRPFSDADNIPAQLPKDVAIRCRTLLRGDNQGPQGPLHQIQTVDNARIEAVSAIDWSKAESLLDEPRYGVEIIDRMVNGVRP